MSILSCSRCGGPYRADMDEVPALVCCNCGHRIYCPPPPVPIRTEARAQQLFCKQCGMDYPLPKRRVCRRCFRQILKNQRLAAAERQQTQETL